MSLPTGVLGAGLALFSETIHLRKHSFLSKTFYICSCQFAAVVGAFQSSVVFIVLVPLFLGMVSFPTGGLGFWVLALFSLPLPSFQKHFTFHLVNLWMLSVCLNSFHSPVPTSENKVSVPTGGLDLWGLALFSETIYLKKHIYL